MSVCGGSWKCLNKELRVKNARAPLGIRPLIPISLRNAAAQWPRSPPWKSDPWLSGFFFFPSLFLLPLSPRCVRLSPVFRSSPDPKLLTPSQRVSLSKQRRLLSNSRGRSVDPAVLFCFFPRQFLFLFGETQSILTLI